MRNALGAVLVLVLAASPLVATNYVDGYAENGYTYRAGYWWWGNSDAYTRTWYQPAAVATPCYSYGRCYYSYAYPPGYYVYTFHHSAPKLATYEDHVSFLLGIARDRDKVEGRIRQRQFEHKNLVELTDALGLKGNFRWESYGFSPPYYPGAYANYATASVVASGNTQYGYSTKSLLEAWGDNALPLAVQGHNQAVQSLTAATGNAVNALQGNVKDLSDRQARLLEIVARGDARAKALVASQSSEARVESSVTKVMPTADQRPLPPAPIQTVPGAVSLARQQVIAQKCAACHNSDVKDGGADLSNYDALNDSQKDSVWERIVAGDMPRQSTDKKKPDDRGRLTPAELRLFAVR